MKKKILFILIGTILLTGCTCQYNLTIDGNTYKEEVILNGSNSSEMELFNNKWQIPVDIDDYQNIGDDSLDSSTNNYTTYNYQLSGNKLIFNHDFSINNISNSTAIANCYKMATIKKVDNTLVISTSNDNLCFDKYPTLSRIEINIETTLKAVNNNADKINGNIYTWVVDKDSTEGINLVLDNSDKKDNVIDDGKGNNSNNDDKQNNGKDYAFYIFLGIILVILLIGYALISKMNNKDDDIE